MTWIIELTRTDRATAGPASEHIFISLAISRLAHNIIDGECSIRPSGKINIDLFEHLCDDEIGLLELFILIKIIALLAVPFLLCPPSPSFGLFLRIANCKYNHIAFYSLLSLTWNGNKNNIHIERRAAEKNECEKKMEREKREVCADCDVTISCV